MKKIALLLLGLTIITGCQLNITDSLSITNETAVSQTVKLTQTRTGDIKELTVPANTRQDFSIEKGFLAELTGNFSYKYKLTHATNSLTITNNTKQNFKIKNNLPVSVTLKNFPENSMTPTVSVSVPAFSFSSEYEGEFLAYPEELSDDWRLDENQQQTGELYPYVINNGTRIGYAIVVTDSCISINRVVNY